MSSPASLTALRDRIRQIEVPARRGVLPFDVPAIDRALPGGGLARGAVHEILGAGGDEEDGAAAAGFVAGILARLSPQLSPTSPRPSPPPSGPRRAERGMRRRLCFPSPPFRGEREGPTPKAWEGEVGTGPVLWCLKRPDLYGPGLLAHGLDPGRLVLVRARRDEELLWSMEEGLRTPGLAAVVGEIGHLPMVAGRRLQLAAERSGVTALLLRRWRSGAEAAAERERPSAAVTRWRVATLSSADMPLSFNPLLPLGGEGKVRGAGRETGKENWIGKPRWRVELLRCRGGAPAAWDVEVADATGHVSLFAALADRPAATPRRETGRAEAEPFRRAG